MSFRFEKLIAWQEAKEFVVLIYKKTAKFPSAERFALVDQIRRAAVSITLNIAEGSNRKSDKDFVRFLRIALGSIDEVVTGLYIARDLRYLNTQEFQTLYQKADKLGGRTNALVKSIKQ